MLQGALYAKEWDFLKALVDFDRELKTIASHIQMIH